MRFGWRGSMSAFRLLPRLFPATIPSTRFRSIWIGVTRYLPQSPLLQPGAAGYGRSGNVDMHWCRKPALGVLAVLIAVLGVRTVVRNRDWKDNLTLYSAAVRAVPGSAKVHETLGATYVEVGQLDLARKEFQNALNIDPDYPYALEAYGLVESWKRNYQAAGRLLERAFYLSQRDDPHYDDLAVNLAAAYMQ